MYRDTLNSDTAEQEWNDLLRLHAELCSAQQKRTSCQNQVRWLWGAGVHGDVGISINSVRSCKLETASTDARFPSVPTLPVSTPVYSPNTR